MLEVCAYNVASCFVADLNGAGRIEFCANPALGGTTPPIKDVRELLNVIGIPVYPIIRPARGGDFVYSKEETELIKQEIQACRQAGCKGISTGAASRDNRLDREMMLRIMDWAGPMEITCHKVFDETPDAFEALELLMSLGVKRVLTSGLKKTALEGAPLLSQLIKHAGDRIIIMPGGSVRSTNIKEISAITGAKEFHSSAITNPNSDLFLADEIEVRAIVAAMK